MRIGQEIQKTHVKDSVFVIMGDDIVIDDDHLFKGVADAEKGFRFLG